MPPSASGGELPRGRGSGGRGLQDMAECQEGSIVFPQVLWEVRANYWTQGRGLMGTPLYGHFVRRTSDNLILVTSIWRGWVLWDWALNLWHLTLIPGWQCPTLNELYDVQLVSGELVHVTKNLHIWSQKCSVWMAKGKQEFFFSLIKPTPGQLRQKLWAWGPTVCILTSPRGNTGASSSLRPLLTFPGRSLKCPTLLHSSPLGRIIPPEPTAPVSN